MAIVDGSLQLGYKNTAWFTANASLVLLVGQIVYLEQTGTYKIGNGVTQLSALSFLGVSSYTLTTSEIGSVINSATSATPNDTDLVMSVDTSIAKKNTWTQIKAFLKTYFDTVYATITDLTGYVKKGTLTTNKIPKATSSDTIGDSSITDDGTTVTVASPNGVNKVEVSDSLVKMYYESVINGLRGYVESNDVKSKIFHDLLIQLNANSVTKNGVEVATINDIPTTYDLFITTGNQTTTSNVASNITDLVSPTLTANKRYKISGVLHVGCNNTGGLKIQITLPTGAIIDLAATGQIANSQTLSWGRITSSATLSGVYNSANNQSNILINGEISISSTSGTIQFGFASGANTQTSTIYQLGTQLTLTQIN